VIRRQDKPGGGLELPPGAVLHDEGPALNFSANIFD
jgi:hypothetical protein